MKNIKWGRILNGSMYIVTLAIVIYVIMTGNEQQNINLEKNWYIIIAVIGLFGGQITVGQIMKIKYDNNNKNNKENIK